MIEFEAKLISLKSLPVFADSDLTPIELERLAEHTIKVCYKKGTKISEAGKKRELNIWIISSGKILVYGGDSGQVFNLQTGDCYGSKSIHMDPDCIHKQEDLYNHKW